MKLTHLVTTIIVLACSSIAEKTLAWGERGHDLITRVAVQHMRVNAEDNANLMRPFLLRDHMLGHLSNTPDIVWRADYMSEEARRANSPTHYINLEKVLSDVTRWDDFPREFDEYRALCKSKGLETTDVGTAPWRVLQFYKLIVSELSNLEHKPKELKIDQINKALTYAGLMSHFVADLANPHHTSANYDGQLTGNRGLHAYFESVMVAELPLDLSEKVLKKAGSKRLWLRDYSKGERDEILSDPQKLVWALVADSHRKVDQLTELDNKYSIISKSPINSESRESAQRKPAKEVVRHYERFVVERLAVGVDALAKLWQMAWEDAGKPDMSEFQSYYYPVQPSFITPYYTVDE
ncbi:MAG: hypothetical protein KTR16_08775 [Acidiferrobacterales bacterium]|nr:hypothetical protein [Acidiferrobacterales bacterium]